MLLELHDIAEIESAHRAIHEHISAQKDWFFAEEGSAPLALGRDEFDFSGAHRRLIFSCWTESGSRSWHIKAWSSTGDKLILKASRRMGAEAATLELVPRASAKAMVASIAAARHARCEKLAQIVAQPSVGEFLAEDREPGPEPLLPGAKIESAVLSPGMRRDQPGRYARIVLRLPHERIAVTTTVANSDARNVDSLFSSALLWFNRLQLRPRQPYIKRFLIVVEHNLLDAARQRH